MPENEIILDGMAVEVTSREEEAGLKLNAGVQAPIEAIFNGDGDGLDRSEKFVWVLSENGTVTKQKVVLGKASQQGVQILEGLDSSQTIIVAGITQLREGMQVSVIDQEASQ
jgi:hypothetical protein